jgi:hypothetical protein
MRYPEAVGGDDEFTAIDKGDGGTEGRHVEGES